MNDLISKERAAVDRGAVVVVDPKLHEGRWFDFSGRNHGICSTIHTIAPCLPGDAFDGMSSRFSPAGPWEVEDRKETTGLEVKDCLKPLRLTISL